MAWPVDLPPPDDKSTVWRLRIVALMHARSALRHGVWPAVRNAFDLTQTELAERLGVSQANVAKIEKRSDLLVSTLRSYLAALGGEVRIVVSFQGRDVELSLDALEKTEA